MTNINIFITLHYSALFVCVIISEWRYSVIISAFIDSFRLLKFVCVPAVKLPLEWGQSKNEWLSWTECLQVLALGATTAAACVVWVRLQPPPQTVIQPEKVIIYLCQSHA